MRQLRLGGLQSLLGALKLGYIHQRPHEFQLTEYAGHRAAHGMRVFCGSLRKNEPDVQRIISLLPNRLVDGPVEEGPVFWVNPFHDRLKGGCWQFRIEAEDAEGFLRECQLS